MRAIKNGQIFDYFLFEHIKQGRDFTNYIKNTAPNARISLDIKEPVLTTDNVLLKYPDPALPEPLQQLALIRLEDFKQHYTDVPLQCFGIFIDTEKGSFIDFVAAYTQEEAEALHEITLDKEDLYAGDINKTELIDFNQPPEYSIFKSKDMVSKTFPNAYPDLTGQIPLKLLFNKLYDPAVIALGNVIW